MEEKVLLKPLLNTETEKKFQMKQENLLENISFIGGGHSFELPKCMLCKNLIEDDEKMICKAFPNEIPEDVIFSGYEEECKQGAMFEPMK
nr:MAG TPA: hypothetical protein [Caudoviricetes sp.]